MTQCLTSIHPLQATDNNSHHKLDRKVNMVG